MSRSLRCLLLVSCMAMAWPRASNAQLDFGGGAVPVIDRSNLAQNLLTALRMLHQIDNSDQEVATMLQNLLTATGQAAYDLPTLEQLLRALHAATGPRPTSDRGLDYYYPDLVATMRGLYPGFTPVNPYFDAVSFSHDTILNTHETLLASLPTLVGDEADASYHATRDPLYGTNEGVQGHLQALQTGNAINLSTADAVHRVEKAVGIVGNAIIANNAHTLQQEAWGLANVWAAMITAVTVDNFYTMFDVLGGVAAFGLCAWKIPSLTSSLLVGSLGMGLQEVSAATAVFTRTAITMAGAPIAVSQAVSQAHRIGADASRAAGGGWRGLAAGMGAAGSAVGQELAAASMPRLSRGIGNGQRQQHQRRRT